MTKHFYKSTETSDEHSITLYLQSEINFCSVRTVEYVTIAMNEFLCSVTL